MSCRARRIVSLMKLRIARLALGSAMAFTGLAAGWSMTAQAAQDHEHHDAKPVVAVDLEVWTQARKDCSLADFGGSRRGTRIGAAQAGETGAASDS